MFIPGFLISILTFPGVIVHELSHQLFCRFYKVPVFQVVYFQVGNPAGYVVHEKTNNKWQTIMISAGPFVLNTLLGAIIAFPAALPVFILENAGLLDYFLIYLGVSIAMHAFPSTVDANNIWNCLKEKDTSSLMKIFGYPLTALIYVGSFGSILWLDLLYGIGVAVGLPNLLVWAFA